VPYCEREGVLASVLSFPCRGSCKGLSSTAHRPRRGLLCAASLGEGTISGDEGGEAAPARHAPSKASGVCCRWARSTLNASLCFLGSCLMALADGRPRARPSACPSRSHLGAAAEALAGRRAPLA
jgi:hypothetical protein